MAKTVVGLYDDFATAKKVVRELEQTGFGKDHLRTTSREKDFKSDYGVDADKVNPKYLSKHGIPDEEADFYAEGVRRGGSLVIARVHDDDAQTAADIMARYSPVRYEDRLADYKERGYKGYESGSKPYTDTEMHEERERYRGEGGAERQGRRGGRPGRQARGRARRHPRAHPRGGGGPRRSPSASATRPSTSSGRNVDRAATDADLSDAFQDRTIEVTERDEEAVVSKEARVTRRGRRRQGGRGADGDGPRERPPHRGGRRRDRRHHERPRPTPTTKTTSGATTRPPTAAPATATRPTSRRTATATRAPATAVTATAPSTRPRRTCGATTTTAITKGAFDKAKDAIRHAYNRARH